MCCRRNAKNVDKIFASDLYGRLQWQSFGNRRDLYQKLMNTDKLNRNLHRKLIQQLQLICIGVYRGVHVTQKTAH